MPPTPRHATQNIPHRQRGKINTRIRHTQRECKLKKELRELARRKGVAKSSLPPSLLHRRTHTSPSPGRACREVSQEITINTTSRAAPSIRRRSAVSCRRLCVCRASLHAFQSLPLQAAAPSSSTPSPPAPPATTHSPLTVGAIAPAAAS